MTNFTLLPKSRGSKSAIVCNERGGEDWEASCATRGGAFEEVTVSKMDSKIARKNAPKGQ